MDVMNVDEMYEYSGTDGYNPPDPGFAACPEIRCT